MARNSYDPFGSQDERGPSRQPSSNASYGINWGAAGFLAFIVVAIIAVVGLVWWWFGWRIEPPSGKCAVLFARSGKDIPANSIIAMSEEEKGIQFEPLSEGRYFRNPIMWDWEYHPLKHVQQNQVGILVRKFGDVPPSGQFIVPEKAVNGKYLRGIVDQPLRPGTYRINPYAYDFIVWNAVKVNVGEVGVVTLRCGKDPENPNAILVKDGERGVQPSILRPGTYYLNPYINRVDAISVQSHKTEIEIPLLSRDGFIFPMKGTVEWAIDELFSPVVLVSIGDANDIVNKVILRSALSMARIQGSKYSSADVISGTIRKAFQDEFEKHIVAESAKKHILVKAALISEIEPPEKIASPIRDRQIAIQMRAKYDQEIQRAISDAKVAEQTKMQNQKTRVVSAQTLKQNAIQKATKDQEISVINANRDLEVAKRELEAAENQAQAVIAKGQGEADVIRYAKTAEAAALRAVLAPFGGGLPYARYLYLSRVAPNIENVVSSTESPLAGPLRTLSDIGALPAK